MSEFEKALLLMLNAIRLQLYAGNWLETMGEALPEESVESLNDCLKQSARLADMAMEVAELKEPVEAP